MRHDFAALVQRLLDDDSYAAAAQRFADAHRDHDQHATVAEIVGRCEQVCG